MIRFRNYRPLDILTWASPWCTPREWMSACIWWRRWLCCPCRPGTRRLGARRWWCRWGSTLPCSLPRCWSRTPRCRQARPLGSLWCWTGGSSQPGQCRKGPPELMTSLVPSLVSGCPDTCKSSVNYWLMSQSRWWKCVMQIYIFILLMYLWTNFRIKLWDNKGSVRGKFCFGRDTSKNVAVQIAM